MWQMSDRNMLNRIEINMILILICRTCTWWNSVTQINKVLHLVTK